jgi:hypothetical protein
MSLQDLSLAVDVPWKLIATSNDMLAHRYNVFPNVMWKSSLAVFAYDPDLSDLPDVFKDRALTFLKVVCSITSYAPGCQDLPPYPDISKYPENFPAYEAAVADWKQKVAALKELEQTTYPCSGALVQVAIYPKNENPPPPNQPPPLVDPSKLAYFLSFEPKKRELIEVVTESGESLTQSKSAANIRKGVTSTDSTEDLNVFTGANISYQGTGAGITGQWGTIKRSGSEHIDTTTTDSSRESREGSSHTTSLSQLYHLLNSYHLGTNRAIFFLQSRPHTVQQKDRFTFIDGPQEIEGVQEFFLVVSRPKETALENDYCVDALLYTAHLETESARALLMETKAVETPWQELWAATQNRNPHKDDSWYSGLGFLGGALLAGLPAIDPASTIGALAVSYETNPFLQHTVNGLFDIPVQTYTPPPTPMDLDQHHSTILDTNIRYGDGWRVDRTRGLGGYDLWENPANFTATPLGSDQKGDTTKPQAFIDIIDIFPNPKDPNDVSKYHPDAALHFQVKGWTSEDSDFNFMYHARIKVYFIRDETPSNNRTIPMFVTVRGVSSCPDSPFVTLYDAQTIDPSKRPDIMGEASISPANVAPWLNEEFVSPVNQNLAVTVDTSGMAQTVTPQASAPNSSAKPSGLHALAIANARTRMANEIGNQVRLQLKAKLACPPNVAAHYFRETDYFFNRYASVVLNTELQQLAANRGTEKGLVSAVAAHPLLSTIVNTNQAALAVLFNASKKGARSVKPLPTSTSFPALTLASPALSHTDRVALHRVGILTGLDLVHIPASELALRLGVDETKARQIRLQAIGLSTGQAVPATPPSNEPKGSSEKPGLKRGRAAPVKKPRKR